MLGVINWCTFVHTPSSVTEGDRHYPPTRAAMHHDYQYCHDFLKIGSLTAVVGMPTWGSCLLSPRDRGGGQ